MILSGHMILNEYKSTKITIVPFDESHVNPNSYDLTVGDYVFMYNSEYIDSRKELSPVREVIPEGGYLLKKGKFYYMYAMEKVRSAYYVPILHNKSGIARKGLFTHITADLQQINGDGKILIQLYPSNDIWIFKGQKICQISFWRTLDI